MTDNKDESKYNQNVLLGCGLAAFAALLLLGALIVAAIYIDRQAAHFPGAQLLSSHNNYSRLPYQFRWDDTYLIEEDFRTVYGWYSLRFDLGAESEANGRCVYSENIDSTFIIDRYIGLLVCDTPKGTMAFVNRTTYVNR